MENEKEFNKLKDVMNEVYKNYLDLINEFDYEDLRNFDKRMLLLEAHIKTIEANAAFREYMMHLRK